MTGPKDHLSCLERAIFRTLVSLAVSISIAMFAFPFEPAFSADVNSRNKLSQQNRNQDFEKSNGQSKVKEKKGEGKGGDEKSEFFESERKFFPFEFQAVPEKFRVSDKFGMFGINSHYLVGPGDKFLINFWGRVDDSLIVVVDSDNQMFIPRIGIVDAGGLTYGELETRVSQTIKKAMRNVRFSVSLYERREFKVDVVGMVEKPGSILSNAQMRASEVIAAAGGISSMGSRKFIELRRDKNTFRVDVQQYVNFGDTSLNPFVTDHDMIVVPPLREYVTIRGAVVNPGTFEIRNTDRFKDVVRQLGGYSVHADLSAPMKLSRVTEEGSRENFSIFHSENPKEAPKALLENSLVMKNGDEVFIPSQLVEIPSESDSVFITGEVKLPGPKPYRGTIKAEEYIGLAGGLTSRADYSGAKVYTTGGKEMPLTSQSRIEPGDTIYIPERTFKFWQDHLTIVVTFLTLATTIITITK